MNFEAHVFYYTGRTLIGSGALTVQAETSEEAAELAHNKAAMPGKRAVIRGIYPAVMTQAEEPRRRTLKVRND